MKLSPINILTTISIVILSINLGFSQKFSKYALKESPYTYIFKLNSSQAKQLYSSSVEPLEEAFFSTLVDSFKTQQTYTKQLSQGHYLKTQVVKNKLVNHLTSVTDYQVKTYNNNTDLIIKVHSKQGDITSDVKIKLNNKTLDYSNKYQAFVDKKSNKNGLLEVSYNNFTSFHLLDRSYNNSWLKRSSRTLAYQTPAKYIWLPIKYIFKLPIDGFKSIKRGYAEGQIYKTKQFFINSYEWLMCLFDPSYCEEPSNQGYVVLNKPKFKPKDTLRLKSIIVHKRKRYQKAIDLYILNNKKRVFLKTIKPYSKGAYETSIFLHDSLDLKLDNYYYLSLETKQGDQLESLRFKYEDYVLGSIALEVNAKSQKHYQGQTQTLMFKGRDFNDLPLLDAQLKVFILSKQLTKTYKTELYVKDTLWQDQLKLKPEGETTLELPETIFPEANMQYVVKTVLTTSDNEIVENRSTFNYFKKEEHINFELERDSLQVSYEVNGITTPQKIQIYGVDTFGNSSLLKSHSEGLKIKISPYYSSYQAISKELTSNFNITQLQSQLNCYTEKTADSLFIKVENPLKIPFVYDVFKRNKRIASGQTKSLDFKKSISSKQDYFISIGYLWGGELQSKTYVAHLKEKSLNIEVTQPSIIYPGDTTNIGILVKDYKNKPQEEVDITAFGLTSKFNYSPPRLKDFSKVQKPKTLINNFDIQQKSQQIENKLDFERWEKSAGLDSLNYYKLIYPKNGIYRNETLSQNAITQFAPFIVDDGQIIPANIIYVDNSPVYFSFTDNIQPYSFAIDTSYHQISIRTKNHLIKIDSLKFKPKHKSIISIDLNSSQNKLEIIDQPSVLSQSEKNRIYPYVMLYDQPEDLTYLKNQKAKLYFLASKANLYKTNNLSLGPIRNKFSVHRYQKDSFDLNFESNYHYNFKDRIVKLKSITPENYINPFSAPKTPSFTDEVITEQSIQRLLKTKSEALRQRTPVFKNSRTTTEGNGRLQLINNKKTDQLPLNFILINNSNQSDFKVYKGLNTRFQDLKPSDYTLICFYNDQTYSLFNKLEIKANTTTYLDFEQLKLKKFKDSFSDQINTLINSADKKQLDKPKLKKELENTYQNYVGFFGEGKVINGLVTDRDQLPLPGANIIIKGTSYGTQSDFDGNFQLRIPKGKNIIVVKYLGFKTKEVNITTGNYYTIALEEDAAHLDEVVVTGYSAINRLKVNTVNASISQKLNSSFLQSLLGQVAGLNITTASGQPGSSSTVMLRGVSSISSNKEPLIVINGKIYTGNFQSLSSDMIANVSVLKDAKATAIYGNRGANGVILITTKEGYEVPETPNLSTKTVVKQSNTLRTNFSDVAFWKPKLLTNKEGKVNFQVVFPDDVTQWDIHYLGFSDHLQTGQVSKRIKAYKPIMGQLSVPRFLIEQDSIKAIGKSQNYLKDSLQVISKSFKDDKLITSKKALLKNIIIDSIPVIANTQKDSLKITYSVEKTTDNYRDGEARYIPVLPKGIKRQNGKFYSLSKDTIKFDPQPKLGKVKLVAHANLIDILETEINTQINYFYNCNEQLSAKLKALLAKREINIYKGIKFKESQSIKKLIKQLSKNQKTDFLWGWWRNSPTNIWASLQVVEALTEAKKQGFTTPINQNMIGTLVVNLESTKQLQEKINLLKILANLNHPIDYKTYTAELEEQKLNLNQKLQILEILKLAGLKTNLNELQGYKKESILGHIYFQDSLPNNHTFDNSVQNTLLAYRILRQSNEPKTSTLTKMRQYLIAQRQTNSWRNTFESAQIIQTLLPDILAENSIQTKQELFFKQNEVTNSISDFPKEIELSQNPIQLWQNKNAPIFLSLSQSQWISEPEAKQKHFKIKSQFNPNSKTIKAGEVTKMNVQIEVLKKSNYVILEIPIPAGCDYYDKKASNPVEVHREYFKNYVSIFCEALPEGTYDFDIALIPKFSGTYTLNPAQIKLMYFESINANTTSQIIKIK